jgi:hypothetical protein
MARKVSMEIISITKTEREKESDGLDEKNQKNDLVK